jgi:hypothetical protein
MRTRTTKTADNRPPTLAELVATVAGLTHNRRLSAVIVADMINSRKVRLEGLFHGRRVVIG